MVGAAAVSSLAMAALSTLLLRRFGPSRVIPVGYLLGAVLHGAEWVFIRDFPRFIAAFLYIHVVALGSVLLSGFWAVANEQFDARQARRRFGQIAAFGTLGTLVGGMLATAAATVSSTANLLLLLLVLQLATAGAMFWFAPAKAAPNPEAAPPIPEVVSGAPYLLGLASLVILAAMAATALDYLFKAQASLIFAHGAPLSRFFSIFYTAASLLTFTAQVGLSKPWLRRFGPGRTVAALPATVTGVSLASAIFPGTIAIIGSRAIELVLRGSLYRSGYELFYTPMPAGEKRSVKSMIDIGAERLGDGLAAALVQLMLELPAQLVSAFILGVTALISGVAAWLAFRLDRAYVAVLEKGLMDHTLHMKPEEAEDLVTRSVVLRTISSSSVSSVPKEPQPHSPTEIGPPLDDPVLRRLIELRSGNTRRIRASLAEPGPLPPLLVPQVVELLGWDEVAQSALNALSRTADGIAGQLIDALENPATPPKVRRRIPKVLASCKGNLAWTGLIPRLRDPVFEVRVQCGKALERMRQRRPEYRMDEDVIFERIEQELSGIESSTEFESSSRVIKHVFTLLGLALPARPVRLAFRALRTGDQKLRAVALEYLDSVLPRTLREKIRIRVEEPASIRPGLPPDEALARLLESSPSISAKLMKGKPRAGRVEGTASAGE
ncbi:MAG TPA: hypothetical protein VFW83_08585, partial [Bryobacteraceae bacterium]|nr:hypothetical protein [Bryobacteraceae bacterium]